MKRVLLILGALSLAVMLLPVPSPAPAQDDWDVEFRARRRAAPPPVTLPPVHAAPVGIPVYGGTGCRGQYQSGGCVGRSAAPQAYALMPVPVQGGGCQSRMAGCYGSGPVAGYGYAAPAYGVPVYAGPRPFAYGVDGVPLSRGAPRGDGKYATESGNPLPPGFVPWDGPVIGTFRAAAGYNRRR